MYQAALRAHGGLEYGLDLYPGPSSRLGEIDKDRPIEKLLDLLARVSTESILSYLHPINLIESDQSSVLPSFEIAKETSETISMESEVASGIITGPFVKMSPIRQYSIVLDVVAVEKGRPTVPTDAYDS